jgi:hypothetical protein
MHASIACLLLYEDYVSVYVWVSLGNVMKAKQGKGRGFAGDEEQLEAPEQRVG